MSAKVSADYAVSLNASFETERLIIEPMMGSHAEIFFTQMQNEAIYQWISSNPPPSLDQLQQSWKKKESRLSPEGDSAWLNWAVRRKVDGVYLGRIDAEVNGDFIASNLGYIFFQPFWGQGYGSESVLAVSNHLVKMGVKKQFAYVTDGNLASCRVLEKSGFNKSRLLLENDLIRGEKVDDIEFVREAF